MLVRTVYVLARVETTRQLMTGLNDAKSTIRNRPCLSKMSVRHGSYSTLSHARFQSQLHGVTQSRITAKRQILFIDSPL
ncbi:hypothetical protein RRG08_057484 [Elysia crispata]|uniref:Uncharacterized protein n=1 Tax=Elysia crispata TaxID=231223 RepID=A0AAE0XYD1_9GAST|nr:hypothetical protein RRG08_057484 [Elysia crispata]